MSAYSEEVLAMKLTRLNGSQQAVQTLSHWIMYHRKRFKTSVDTWKRVFEASLDPHKKVLLFLANDIIQNSRKKGQEFVQEFALILPGVVAGMAQKGGESEMKTTLARVLGIWEERGVYQAEFIAKLRTDGNIEPVVPREQPAGVASRAATTTSPLTSASDTPLVFPTDPFSTALREVDEASVLCALAAEKVDALPESLFDASRTETLSDPHLSSVWQSELEDSLKAIIDLQGKLVEDIQRRERVINLLTDALEDQSNNMETAQMRLRQCDDRLKQAEGILEDMRHRSSHDTPSEDPSSTTKRQKTSGDEWTPLPSMK